MGDDETANYEYARKQPDGVLQRSHCMLDRLLSLWFKLQKFTLDGGTFVDLFAVVTVLRLCGPLFGRPPMNLAEAGVWSATIAAFAASNIGAK